MSCCGKVVCLLLGGPTYEIFAGVKSVAFEVHPYCGPTPVSKLTGDPLVNIPKGFWDAIERWQAGGSEVKDGVAVTPSWCPVCRGSGDQVRHMGGKHWEVLGRCPVCNGSKLEASTV